MRSAIPPGEAIKTYHFQLYDVHHQKQTQTKSKVSLKSAREQGNEMNL